MDLKLAGLKALVTGAGTGIGRGIALTLAGEGVRLGIAGRKVDALEALRGELLDAGCEQVETLPGDLSVPEGVAAVADRALAAFGTIDVLVNNAGGSRPLTPADGESTWQESFDLNFSAARRLSERLMPGMIAKGFGRIVNLTGATVYWNVNAATPAKAALQSWAKGLAAEVAPKGITVNCIAPGRINSHQILTRLHPTEASRQQFIAANIPIGYFGEPEDVANVVAFLASPRNGYLTGITIPVDGGLFRLSF